MDLGGDPALAKKIILTRACEVSPDVRVEKIADSLCSMGHKVSVLAWNRVDTLPRAGDQEFWRNQAISNPSGIRHWDEAATEDALVLACAFRKSA